MNRLYTRIFTVLSLCITLTASAQQGADNIAQATKALDEGHKCDEAMRLLNGVPTESRQNADYLLCMAKTQDCMQNSEQALYYYNKYLALKPNDDAAKRRTAELTDAKNRQAKASGEAQNAKVMYQTASKNRKRRRRDLDDNYYAFGFMYGAGMSEKSPFKNEYGLHITDGFVIIDNHALLELNISTSFLGATNQKWFNDAVKPITLLPNNNIGKQIGFAEALTIGFAPIIVNNRDIALTAGVIGGIHYYMLPLITSYADISMGNTFTLCYGIKSNLYLGQNFMIFASYLFNSAKTADISSSYVNYTVPANYNLLNIGMALKVDAFW